MKEQAMSKKTQARLAELEARLAEAEETLRAIRSGEVDALVVSTARGDQVFSLQGADRIYRLLVETMNEGAVTLAADGTILHANGFFAARLKRPLEKVIGTCLRDYVEPAGREFFDALLRSGLAGSSRGEIRLCAADDSLVPVYLALSALQADDSPGMLLAVVTDLTEQKRNEAIVAAEKLARSILEQAAEAILVCDETGRITHANWAAQRLCGQNPLLQPFDAALPLRRADGASFSLSAALSGVVLDGIEVRLERADLAFDMLLSAGPLRDSPDGAAWGVVVSLNDVTRLLTMQQRLEDANAALQAKNEELQSQAEELQSQAEELQSQAEEIGNQALKLGEERTRLQTIIDSAPEAILVADERGQVVLANPAAERLFAAPAPGAAWPERYREVTRYNRDHTPIDRQRLPLFSAAVRGETQRNMPISLLWPDGQWRDVLASTVPILDSRGQVRGAVGTYQDITDIKRAEQALRRERDLVARLLETSPAGIMMVDRAGQIVFANARAEGVLGLAREEVIGRAYNALAWQITDYDGQPFPDEQLPVSQVLATAQPVYGVRHAIQRPDGRQVLLSINAAPLFDPSGQVDGVVTSAEDVTGPVRVAEERERLLEQTRHDRESIAALAQILQQEWDTLQIIMESTPAQLAYLDHEFTFVRVNSAYVRNAGRREEDLIGHNYFDLFPDGENRALFEQVRATGQPVTLPAVPFESAGQPERGVAYWDWTLVPVKEGDGQARGLVLSLLDVTDQVLSRRAVEELAARDEAILNSLTEGIVTFDPAGNILTINPAALRILGFEGAEQAQQSLKEFPHLFEARDLNGEAVPVEKSPQTRLLRGETFSGYELQARNLAADATWVGSFSGAPVRDAAGNLAMGVLAMHDITAEKQAQAQRDAMLGELQAALAEKEVLMREIYHRVKNNVQALIYLMDMQADYILDEDSRHMVRELQERARAMALVHEKLYQSQNLAQIDFGDYLNDLVDNLSHAFGGNRSIIWRIDAASVPLGVDAAIPCGLIVSELLTNSLKYAFPAGKPRAKRPASQPGGQGGPGTDCTISVESRVDGDQITLIVSDNGVGLPAEVDWDTTKTLGLQLVNILARHQLGGQVEVDRRGGTTFTITFAERRKK